MRVLQTGIALIGLVGSAQGGDRLPTIPPANYSPEQKQAAAEFEAARKTPPFGPFEFMMHSPKAMTAARAMGDYFRFNSALGNTLSEFAILLTAREWSQSYEWSVHYPIAIKAGIAKVTADAIAQGRHPKAMSADEEMIYDFVTELLKSKQVSAPVFERVKSRFGAQGAVDLTGIVGYYTFLAMQLNVAQYPAPKDGALLPTTQ
jgi:4-carboxymuconolactone decarboxylase